MHVYRGSRGFVVEWRQAAGVLSTPQPTQPPAGTMMRRAAWSFLHRNARGWYSVGSAAAAGLAPTIVTQPVSAVAIDGQVASFSVVAAGSAPLSYQWLRNGAPIPGATSSTLLYPAGFVDNGAYIRCRVVNAFGQVETTTVVLVVTPVQPTILLQPVSASVQAGQQAQFSVAAQGSPNLQYQWHRNGVPIIAAISPVYITPKTAAIDNGAAYTVTVTNAAGQVVSVTAVLSVASPPPAPAPSPSPAPAPAPAPAPCGGKQTLLDGLSLELLQAKLTALQLAYLDLQAGAKIASASYSQGDGAKAVTYTQANMADLAQAIMLVQQQIATLTGCAAPRRRAIRPYFSRR